MNERISPVAEDLRRAGLRVTHHRGALLLAMRSTERHARAEELRAAAADRGTVIPLPTVYSVLEDLVRAGLARTLRGEGGMLRFDANVERHHHLSCIRCGALQDIPCVDIDESDPCIALSDSRGWVVHAADVTFRGVCPNCEEADARLVPGNAMGNHLVIDTA